MAKLFNENNESLILKNFKEELSHSNENRRNSEKNKTRRDNIRSSMRDAIEDYEKINIQRKHVKSMRSQRLNELRLMITSQMIPFFQNLREGFIELKDFIENVLIPGYKNDYSDFALDIFYIPLPIQTLHKSFIDTFLHLKQTKD